MTIARIFLVIAATLQMVGCGGNTGIRQGEPSQHAQVPRSQECQQPPREELCNFERDESAIPTKTSDDRAEILAWESALPGTKIRVLVFVVDPEFDSEQFPPAREVDAQSQAIEVRKKQVDAVPVDIVLELECLGIKPQNSPYAGVGFEIDSLRVARVVATWPIEYRVTIDR